MSRSCLFQSAKLWSIRTTVPAAIARTGVPSSAGKSMPSCQPARYSRGAFGRSSGSLGNVASAIGTTRPRTTMRRRSTRSSTGRLPYCVSGSTRVVSLGSAVANGLADGAAAATLWTATGRLGIEAATLITRNTATPNTASVRRISRTVRQDIRTPFRYQGDLDNVPVPEGAIDHSAYTWDPVTAAWVHERGPEIPPPPPPPDVHALQTYFFEPESKQWIRTVLADRGRELAKQWRGAHRIPTEGAVPAVKGKLEKTSSPIPVIAAVVVLLLIAGGAAVFASQSGLLASTV